MRKLAGVQTVKADYPSETVCVSFDPTAISLDNIRATIERVGYRTFELDDPARRRGALAKFAGLILGVAGILLIILLDTEWISQSGAPDITQHLSLSLIFVLGLLTGFHCVGMCGGFVLSYVADDANAGRRSYLSHLLYGAGKTLSYTVIGATFGLVGAFVAFTPRLRGVAGVLAGAFLIVFGLNMLGLFAPLRRFRLGLPAPVQRFVFERQARDRHRPFVIGLLNGLMIACGPLQAMYVMAAGTGSAVEGAKMLFAFGVGTLPVLLSFGFLATLISGSVTHRLLKAQGAIVVILGAVMINRGLILTGLGYDLRSITSTVSRMSSPSIPIPKETQSSPALQNQKPIEAAQTRTPPARPAFQTIEMDVDSSSYSPNHFDLRRGIPVKWIINGKQVTSCNHRIVVPSLNLEFDVKPGRQTIEFTPTKVGVIPWSCWMGMLHGDFEVMEAPPSAPAPQKDVVASRMASKEQAPLDADARSLPMGTRSYTIKFGDTLSSVAVKFFHDARRWRDIAAANPGVDARRLRPGQVIKLPGVSDNNAR